MNKNTGIALVLIAGAVVIAAILVLLARGGSYSLTVTDPALGSADAPLLIEEFSDYQCPACQAAQPALEEALQLYGDKIRFVYKDFPLSSIHPQAGSAAAGALCAGEQGKYWEFHGSLFDNQTSWGDPANDSSVNEATLQALFSRLVDENGLDFAAFETCRNSRQARQAVRDDVKEGEARGVTATPTFFLNGEKVRPTPASVLQWIKVIDAKLQEPGLLPPTPAEPTAEPPLAPSGS